MKTTFNSKPNQRTDSILVSIALFFMFSGLIAMALHVTPNHIIAVIENFATHHFVLVVVFLFFVSLLGLRYYYGNTSNQHQNGFLKRRNASNPKTSLLKLFKQRVSVDYQTLKSNFIGIHSIDSLVFSEKDVLSDVDLKSKRENDLIRAMKLGNSYKQKVTIYFKDINSNKHLYTSVWFVSSTHVTLKYGIVIPIRSIYDVKIN